MNCNSSAIKHSRELDGHGVLRWIVGLGRRMLVHRRRADRLYMEGMPDRVKRDLGFLDGREPRYEAELRR